MATQERFEVGSYQWRGERPEVRCLNHAPDDWVALYLDEVEDPALSCGQCGSEVVDVALAIDQERQRVRERKNRCPYCGSGKREWRGTMVESGRIVKVEGVTAVCGHDWHGVIG